MSATLNTSSDTLNAEHAATGYKVIGYALQCLAWGCTVAIAFSCSSIIMGIIMFIIMSIVMSLLSALLSMLVFFKVDAVHIETLGRTTTNAAARVRSIFTRTPAAA